MDVKEVQEMAAKLDEEIRQLIDDFQQATGCRVIRVGLNNERVLRVSEIGNSYIPFVRCDIELR